MDRISIPKGKRKTQNPCPGCFLHLDRCLCSEVPKISILTKLTLIIHAQELKRTTNTGMLAAKALANSEVMVRGRIGEPLDLNELLKLPYQHLLLYPSAEATELDQNFVKPSGLPVNLIVPDGNWRQASKIHYRHKELAHVPRVFIKDPIQDANKLRFEATPNGMSTLKAIAYAMGALESLAVQQELLQLYELKLQRTIEGRGKIFHPAAQ